VDEDMLRVMVANEEDVTKVVTTLITDMSEMLRGDVPSGWEFNQDISSWDVSNVTDMNGMFEDASSFNQDIGDWNVNGVNYCFNFNLNTPQWTLPKPNFTNCNT
ncbi:BspA family leucine-rich repeat surface protein, partial [Flavobacteriaceae bacterium]|nr:BspA family leucine-rich repeat surface protein [Flavobacteriaceae bacterium]